MSSEPLLIAQDFAEVVVVVVFLLAAFRAATISRALVNRVYRNRGYITSVFAVLVPLNMLIPDSWTIAGLPLYVLTYFIYLAFIFVLVDSTILVSLDTDFFHRNTLRWRQIRLVAYLAVVFIEFVALAGNYLPWISNTLIGEAIIAFILVCVYSASTAVVSARRSSDMPLRRFMAYTGILLLLYLVNTLIYVLVTDAVAPFLSIVFGYVTYRMAMSLSPVARVERVIEASPGPA